MRFQVPQFIEVEDKIFGPLTLKQFIYLAGGGGLAFAIYVFINNLFISIIPIAAVLGLSAALAFYKVNNKPFVEVMESAFKYYFGNKLYIWRKQEKDQPQTTQAAVKAAKNYASVMVPKISDSKLKDLTWSLDIKESIYSNKNQK
ncbi:MAG: PrgI family protein [Patescibacteria group bacterium]|nr:PrgI family protein [Patescibacteria group bacterium]MDE1967092.1 PrgI family protein [Patescibacteria group bacterium]